jgi:hypothetical protein
MDRFRPGGDATSGVPDNAEAVLEPMSHGLGAAVTELAVDDEWFWISNPWFNTP